MRQGEDERRGQNRRVEDKIGEAKRSKARTREVSGEAR